MEIDNFHGNINNFANNDNILKLTKEDSQYYEGLITKQECENTFKIFKLNKSPWCDGFQLEFNKYFGVK